MKGGLHELGIVLVDSGYVNANLGFAEHGRIWIGGNNVEEIYSLIFVVEGEFGGDFARFLVD